MKQLLILAMSMLAPLGGHACFETTEIQISNIVALEETFEQINCSARIVLNPQTVEQGLLSNISVYGSPYAPGIAEYLYEKGFSRANNSDPRYYVLIDYVLVNPRRANDESYLKLTLVDEQTGARKAFGLKVPVLAGNSSNPVRNRSLSSMVYLLVPKCHEIESMLKLNSAEYLETMQSRTTTRLDRILSLQ